MQFPESWLREFCNPPVSTQQLAETLTMAGLEVEDMKSVAPPFSKVVVGLITSAEQHPNADRLRVCQVDVGQSQALSIVCGAPNARVGIKVPCAMVGAELPPGADGKAFLIKLSQLRGVESQGMLCSSRELHLSQEHEGLLELSAEAIVGQDIREHLLLDDTLFTLKLTPNLAHCQSVYGIARELSALTGTPLQQLEFPAVHEDISEVLPVKITATDLCGRFSGRVLKHVNPKAATPSWMVERLARCGQRSVSALVDISNYVMFELGRPSHIFDLDKINQGLVVRWAKPGETLKLLNGHTVALDEKVGVIADASQVESLAGIMGGDATAVSDDTQNIYIEAAFWWPKAVAGRSRRFNFSTDAGYRFERGVDPEQTLEHIERITRLVLDICGTPQSQVGKLDDHQPHMPVRTPVTMRVTRANKVLGVHLTQERMSQALTGLGLSTTEAPGVITVTPPSFRFDLNIEEDLIEEVARMVGYDNLPTTAPLAPITPHVLAEKQRHPFAVRRSLAALGYQETINFSFVDAQWEKDLAGNKDPILLLNPIASHMSVMRSTLIGSLLQVVKFNADRKASRVRVFELGRVFHKSATVQDSLQSIKGIDQPMMVAGMAWGPVNELGWNTESKNVDFFDVKADVEALFSPRVVRFEAAQHPAYHPGRCARISLEDQAVGWLGEMHPQWRQLWDLSHAPVMFELQLHALLHKPVPKAAVVPKLQAVERDIAVVVSEDVSHQLLMDCIWVAPTQGLLQDAVLFDVYRPTKEAGSVAMGEKSLAVRLILQSTDDATLTDTQIEQVVQAVVQQLTQQLNARLRT
jgi:phenylalanyl-tRNA synthetase beta chain